MLTHTLSISQSMVVRLFLNACFIFLLGLTSAAGAADGETNTDIEQTVTIPDAQTLVKQLQAQIADGSLTEESTSLAGEQLPLFLKLARACIDKRQRRLDTATEQLTTLGTPTDNEDATLKAARKALAKEVQNYQNAIAVCKLLLVESEVLLEKLKTLSAAERTAKLLIRSPNIFSQLVEKHHPYDWFNAILETEIRHLGMNHLDEVGLPFFIVLTTLLLMVGFYVKKSTFPRLEPPSPEATLATEIVIAFRASAVRYLPSLLVFAGWTVFWIISARNDRPWPQLAVVSFSLFGFILASHIGRSFFSPPQPARHYLPIDEQLSKRFWRALYSLIIITAISFAIFNSPFYQGLAEPILVLARAIDTVIFTTCLIWVIWLAFTLNSLRGIGLFRPLVTLALTGGLIAELLGYRNLSSYIIGSIFYSMIGLGLAWVISRLASDFLDGLDQGHHRWEQRLRYRLGLAETQSMPGLIWLRLIAALLVWGGLAWFLLRIWGLSESGEAVLFRYINQGFSVGPLTIIPRQIAMALIFFTLLLAIVAWLKQQLDQNWLSKTRIDRGARDAAITISGYVGTGLALLIALSVAGVDFKNFAIIAGALSVGIGFGMQNIVNNFVSGLSLLFERPIRTGDWIVVGNTQGYVKSINIRSTQIMTFDRADVIVPHSELISGQVTNWMLRDLSGRVCVPIGVAYGTDTAMVKEVLLKVAEEHPAPVKNGTLREPHVLFLGFGDSSLNFELRFFIAQIDDKLNVLSDINFAIDSAFRQAGIEIPFPQRDLHIRQWPSESIQTGIIKDSGD